MSLWLMHALSSQSSVDGASFLEVAHDERAFHLSAAESCHECDRKASTDPSVTGFVFWLRPVSPDVAPTMVARWPRSASTWSISRPSSCMATSLKASVGPWNSSSTKRFGASCTSGVTAGWRNCP